MSTGRTRRPRSRSPQARVSSAVGHAPTSEAMSMVMNILAALGDDEPEGYGGYDRGSSYSPSGRPHSRRSPGHYTNGGGSRSSSTSSASRRIHFADEIIDGKLIQTALERIQKPTSLDPLVVGDEQRRGSPLQRSPQGVVRELSPIAEPVSVSVCLHCADSQTEIGKLRRTIEQQEFIIKEQMHSLDTAAVSARQIKALQEDEVANLQRKLSSQLQAVEEENVKLRFEVNQLTEANAKVEGLQQENEHLRSRVSALAVNLEEARTVIENNLKQRHKQKDLSMQRSAASEATIEKLEDQLQELHNEKAQLRSQNAGLLQHTAAQQQQAIRSQKDVERLRQQLEDSEAKLQEVTGFVQNTLAPFVADTNPLFPADSSTGSA